MNEKNVSYFGDDVFIVTKRSLLYFTGLNNCRTANIFKKLSVSPSKSCTVVFMIENCIFVVV